MKSTKSRRSALLLLPLSLFLFLFVLGPLVYMTALSFASNQESGYGFSWTFTLENYRRIFEPVYLQCFIQSFRLAFSTTLLVVLLGYPFGCFLARLDKRPKKIVLFLIMIPFWTSSLIRLYGWIIILQAKGVLNAVLKWLGLIEKPLKILYSYPAVLIGMVYALLPFMMLSVYSCAEKLDWTLAEASHDLGAGRLKTFLHIILPLTLPGLFSGIILTFVPSMGLFFLADILGGNKIVLVGNLIQDQLTRGSNWPFAAALAVVLTVLTSIMIFLYRKITHVKDLEGLF